MELVLLVSLLNASILSIAVLGCLMFISTPAYRGLCALLALVSFSALANLLEDLHLSRDLHLVSPVFVLAYGPAFYFSTKRLISGPIGYKAVWHFLPVLFVLPFTASTQTIIAIGTVWRIAYAILTIKLILEFNRQLTTQRSDASEVSLAWFGWLIGISTFFGALDLFRLNFQPELGLQLNMLGYAAGRAIFFVILLSLILILNNRRAALETIGSAAINTNDAEFADSSTQPGKNEESAADYQSLFAILDKEIRAQRWYNLPRLTLSQLSELSGMSTRDISRCINLVAGMSFNDYVNLHRIEQIKSTLTDNTNGNTNLTDLALAAGFSSKATFNQSFKKITGMTPSEYRSMKQHIQNQDSGRLESGH